MKNKNKIRVIVLFVQYNQKQYNYSYKLLISILNKFSDFDFFRLVIDNSIEDKNFVIDIDNGVLIGGDNSEREFSGWECGLRYVESNIKEYDLILFINEAFNVYGDAYINRYLRTAANRSLKFNAVAGPIDKDEKNRTLRLYDFGFKRWLRTNMFFVPKAIMDKIGCIITLPDSEFDKFVSPNHHDFIENTNDYFLPSAPINDQFKAKIISWLTDLWHGKFEINDDSWDKFRMKYKAIINEAMFTKRIIESGSDIISYAPLIIIYMNKLKHKIKFMILKFKDKI